jgi:hypothetical protein
METTTSIGENKWEEAIFGEGRCVLRLTQSYSFPQKVNLRNYKTLKKYVTSVILNRNV